MGCSTFNSRQPGYCVGALPSSAFDTLGVQHTWLGLIAVIAVSVTFIRWLLLSIVLLEVLIGEASPELITHSRHCHYGLVVALFVLARHTMAPQLDAKISEGQNYAVLAMRLLGGFAALDFLEDSSWPLSSLAEGLVVVAKEAAEACNVLFKRASRTLLLCRLHCDHAIPELVPGATPGTPPELGQLSRDSCPGQFLRLGLPSSRQALSRSGCGSWQWWGLTRAFAQT